VEYGGVERRWIVVFSEKAFAREEKTLGRRRKGGKGNPVREQATIGAKRFARRVNFTHIFTFLWIFPHLFQNLQRLWVHAF